MIWQSVVFVGWLAWLLIYWQGGVTTLRDIRAAVDPADRLLLVLMSLGTMLLILLMAAALIARLPVTATPILIMLGTTLVFAGIAGTFFCRSVLGKFWTAEAVVQTDHQVIDAGPYGVVRHPIYSFAILLYAGTALTFLNGWTLLFAGGIAAAYVIKARLEDRMLGASLPGYADYSRRVKYRLLPGIW